jgi:SPX domain protein involved in polyphosphate accumulation
LTRDLRAFVDADDHAGADGFYVVRSLYLDSPDWRCFHEKNAGLNRRHKLRVRGYVNGDTMVGPVKLEVKQRQGSRIRKSVGSLSIEEYEDVRKRLGRQAATSTKTGEDQTHLERFFRLAWIGRMSPVVNVQFRRQAFHARTDRGCRMTIDDRLTARRSNDLFDTMNASNSLLSQNRSVFEIKVEQALPLWAQQLVHKYRLQLTSLSKYGYSVMNCPFGLEWTV